MFGHGQMENGICRHMNKVKKIKKFYTQFETIYEMMTAVASVAPSLERLTPAGLTHPGSHRRAKIDHSFHIIKRRDNSLRWIGSRHISISILTLI